VKKTKKLTGAIDWTRPSTFGHDKIRPSRWFCNHSSMSFLLSSQGHGVCIVSSFARHGIRAGTPSGSKNLHMLLKMVISKG
jgi:hypothetical protein